MTDPFQAFDRDFDLVCAALRSHGIADEDVQYVARRLLIGLSSIGAQPAPSTLAALAAEVARRCAPAGPAP